MTEISSPIGEETPSVLIVGDIPEEVARARRILERYCFRVLSPPCLQEALDALSKEAFVAIIADEVFDGASGIDFLRRAMTLDGRPRRMLIGSPEAPLLAAAINQGWLFACLPRPFDSRTLSHATLRASEAYFQKEEQRRLVEELRHRVLELEAEVRLLSNRLDSVQRLPEEINLESSFLLEENKLLGAEHYESGRAIPVKLFSDLPPKPFQSSLSTPASEGFITERDLVAVHAPPPTPEGQPSFAQPLRLALDRLVAGLSAGAPPEETAWGLAALVLLGKDGGASSAIRRATARLVGLAGSGRGGSIAAWALTERFLRTQSPAERDLAEAALAWVSLPSLSTPDLAATGSLLALVAGAEGGLIEGIGAKERLRAITTRLAPSLSRPPQIPLLAACLLALADYNVTGVAQHLVSRQRQSGALAGEVNLPDLPPLVATSMATLIFGAKELSGAVANILRAPTSTTHSGKEIEG